MTTWKLLYENSFPRSAETRGTTFEAFRAAEGSQSIQSGPVFIIFTGFAGFGIGDGRNITYRPDEALQDVIGIDISMEIGLLQLFEGRPLTLFTTETSGLSATLTATEPPAVTEPTTCRLTLRMDGSTIAIDGLKFRQRFGGQQIERRRLQVRWATNGQMHVLLDGLLVAYENAVKAGHRFNLGQLSIGNVDQSITGVINAAVNEFRLVELREDSAIDALGEQLDPQCIPEISERCEKSARAGFEQLMREARQLAAAFNGSQSSPWREDDGGSPFTSRAQEAFKSGNQAAVAFSQYLRDGSPERRQEVSSNLQVVLEALAIDQPDLFKELAVKAAVARKALDEHCKEAAYEVRAHNPQLFKLLDPLNTEIDELVQRLAGAD